MKNIDIAKRLNISTATVSLVLNGKPGVSDRVRDMVFDFIRSVEPEQSKYLRKPDESILLIIHKKHGLLLNGDHFISDITQAIHQIANTENLELKIAYYTPDIGIDEFISDLSRNNAEGIMLLATEMQEQDILPYLKIKKPLILIDNRFLSVPLDSFSADNNLGVYKCVKLLKEYGHEKIGFVMCDLPITNFEERYRAFFRHMETFGLPIREEFIYHVRWSTDYVNEDMLKLLTKAKEIPTAVILCNTLMGFAAGRAFKQMGYAIPADISTLSFADTPYAQLSHPPGTTVKIDAAETGRQAAKRLIERMRQRQNPLTPIHVSVDVELIIRGSVRNLERGTGNP